MWSTRCPSASARAEPRLAKTVQEVELSSCSTWKRARSSVVHERERALAVGGHVDEARKKRHRDELGNRRAVDDQCELPGDPCDAAADAQQCAEQPRPRMRDTVRSSTTSVRPLRIPAITCDSSVRASAIKIVPPTAMTWVFASAAIESSVKSPCRPGSAGWIRVCPRGACLVLEPRADRLYGAPPVTRGTFSRLPTRPRRTRARCVS